MSPTHWTALLASLLAELLHRAARGLEQFRHSNLRLLDGERASVNRNVVVSDGRILQIGSAYPLPRSLEVVDGEGRTLLPGLSDSHVHLPAAPKQALPWRHHSHRHVQYGW